MQLEIDTVSLFKLFYEGFKVLLFIKYMKTSSPYFQVFS